MTTRPGREPAASVLLNRRHRPLVIACPRPWHGLGNRMRSLLGTRVLARHVDRDFAYTWPVGRRFGARLDELWDVADPLLPSWWSSALAVRHPYRDGSLTWLTEAQDDKIWQVRTPHALALPAGTPSWETELRALTPVADVAGRVARLRAEELGSAPYVGVMIRSHSVAHTETLAASPLAWYIRRLHEIRTAFPSMAFFVSSDTDEALRQVTDQVPNCVALTDKGEYNSRKALQSSVVDLYLLAGSVHILGAHYSSFPELARSLGGDELVLETSQTPDDAMIEQRSSFSQPSEPITPHLRSVVHLTP